MKFKDQITGFFNNDYITVSSYTCPHCREVVKFVVPKGNNLASKDKFAGQHVT